MNRRNISTFIFNNRSLALAFLISFIGVFSCAKPALASPKLAPTEKELESLILKALTSNQQLIDLKSKYIAMQSKANAAGYLPEPMLSGNYFIRPIETRLGAQTANFMLTQPIPWPGKLGAKENIISKKAKGLASKIEALKLEIRFKVKSLYYKGFVLEKRLSYNQAEKSFMRSLSEIALAKVKVGSGGQQNVTQTSLEISRLEQEAKKIRQDINTMKAKINSILYLPASNRIKLTSALNLSTVSFNQPNGWVKYKKNLKISNPNIRMARSNIESATARVKLSKLSQMPDIKLNLSWALIEATPEMAAKNNFEEKSEAYAIGAGITIPIWRGKYNSIEREATEIHSSAIANYQGMVQTIENELADIWQQAATSKELIKIYKDTIIPQAEQILSANQASYRQSGAQFYRVIDDFRRLLKLQTGFIKEEARFMILAAKAEKLIGNSVTDRRVK